MIILALDASSTHVGFTLTDHDEIVRSWERGYKGDLARRLVQIEREVDALVTRDRPHALAVEKPVFVTRRVQSFSVLSELIGILRILAHRRGLRFIEVMPTAAKAALAHGKADKLEMMAAARLILGRMVPEHQADSIGVAFAAWGVVKEESWLDA